MHNNKAKNVTIAGTDIDEIKRLNSQSGLSYNQVKQLLAEKYLKDRGNR